MDGKKIYRQIVTALVFLGLAEGCFLLTFLYSGWDSRGLVAAVILMAGLFFAGITWNLVHELKKALVPKPKENIPVVESRGRVLEYRRPGMFSRKKN